MEMSPQDKVAMALMYQQRMQKPTPMGNMANMGLQMMAKKMGNKPQAAPTPAGVDPLAGYYNGGS